MGFGAALIGGVSGVGIQMISNATRKIPLSREPYLHVAFFFVGCWAGNAYVNLERKLVEDINMIRFSRGQPPIVGTNAWIRYSTTETEE